MDWDDELRDSRRREPRYKDKKRRTKQDIHIYIYIYIIKIVTDQRLQRRTGKQEQRYHTQERNVKMSSKGNKRVRINEMTIVILDWSTS